METFISSEKDFEDHEGSLPEGLLIIYFKLVGIGPNTQKNADWKTKNILSIANKQPGFFAVSDNFNDLRTAMHDFVDRICDSQEKIHEPKN